jgi:phosphotransferase family enzyme
LRSVVAHSSGAIPPEMLDARESPVLKEELPGLPLAFDGAFMRGQLQSILFGDRSGRSTYGTVERCEPAEALYVPEGACVVRYEVGARYGQDEVSFLVTGRVHRDASTAQAYLETSLAPLARAMQGHGGAGRLVTPVGLVEPVNQTVSVFPIDGELPYLIGATDRERILKICREAIPNDGLPSDGPNRCDVELVRYRRQHGCLLRYRLSGSGSPEGAALSVYGKIAGGGEGVLTKPAIDAIRQRVLARAPGSFTVPLIYGFFPDLELVLMESIAGSQRLVASLRSRLHGESSPAPGDLTLEAALDECGRILAMLHSSDISLGPSRSVEDDLLTLYRAGETMLRISPQVGEMFQTWLESLAEAARARPLGLCFSHGDFKYTQLIFDGRHPGLVDFDTVCQAEPALDLGHFSAYLWLATLKALKAKTQEGDEFCEGLCAQFLDAYVGAGGGDAVSRNELAARVRVYELVSLLRLAYHAWQRFKPVRFGYLMAIIEARLASLPSDR